MCKSELKIPEVIVSCFILNDNNELFLVKGTKWQNQYLIPGGHLEYGETLEDCCKREVKEETGLDLKDLIFFTYQDGIKPTDYIKKDVHFVYLYFVAKSKDNSVVLDEEEGKESIWIKPTDVFNLDNVHPDMKKLIQKLIDENYV